MSISPRFLTPAEVADTARVTRRTVYNWLKSGDLRGIRMPGDHWLIPEDALRELFSGGPPPSVVAAAPSPMANSKKKRPK